MAVLLGRFPPVMPVGQVVNGQCPLRARALYSGVVMRGQIERGPSGQLEGAILGHAACAFVVQAQAAAQTGGASEAVLRHSTQAQARHVQGTLAVHAGVNLSRLAFGVCPGGGEVPLPLPLGPACRQLQSSVTGLPVNFPGAGVGLVAGTFVAGHGAGDVKPARLPARAGPLAFDAELKLLAAQRWQSLSGVGVAAAVGCDIGFNAFAVAAVDQVGWRDLVCQGQPRCVEAALVLHRSTAVGALTGAVQTRVAPTQPKGGLRAQLDAVAQGDFGGVFAALGVQFARCGLGLGAVGCAVDVARARPVVGLHGGGAVQQAAAHQAQTQVVAQSGQLHRSTQIGLQRIAAAVFLVAAVVVQVKAAVAAVLVTNPLAAGGGAAKGIAQSVVGAQALSAVLRGPKPTAVEVLLEAQAARGARKNAGHRPSLARDVALAIDCGWQGGHAIQGVGGVGQQTVGIHAHLLAFAALDLPLQAAVGGEAPVHGQGQQVAVAFGVSDVGVQVFVGRIEAVAQRLVLAKTAAQVQRDAAAVARAETGADVAHGGVLGRGRPFDHVVDQTARGAGAGLDAAGAFEQLDAFLVVHADHGFG